MTKTDVEIPAPVIKTVEVLNTPAKAFETFADFGRWWPREKHSMTAMKEQRPATSVTLEPRLGGRIFETTPDGEELPWGVVTIWEPGARIGFTWRIGKPEAESTRVDVTFTDIGDGRTRVELTHDGWDAILEDAAGMRDGYNNGWVSVMGRYAEAA